MESTLGALGIEVQRLVSTGNEQTRRQVIDTLRDLQYALEPPEETMQRLLFPSLSNASIRIALRLDIYNHLTESSEPLTVEKLSGKTKADPILLGRLLRLQASLGIIKEVDKDTFTANTTTKNLTVPEIQSGLIFCNDVLGPVFQGLPDYLEKRQHQNPTNFNDTPFHEVFKTNLPVWAWMHQDPKLTSHFNLFMKAQRSSMKNMFNYYPIEEECKNWPSDRPVFVDVGGGTGQQCVALRNQFPNLPGKIILQDLKAPISEADMPEGVEKMVYDFFTPQPVKGAKYYYFRAVMHDHPDAKCVEILKNTVQSMSEDSVIMLDEIVVPNKNVDWFVTQTDFAMLIQFASMERTEDQWHHLLAAAGLEIRNILTYTWAFKLSVIVAAKSAPLSEPGSHGSY